MIGFVSWFAGLFYLVRMFVYHAEADQKPQYLQEDWKNQYTLMQWRVYKIIATPAMIITVAFGTMMLIANPTLFYQVWMIIKLLLLVLLIIYHFYCKTIIKRQEAKLDKGTSFQYRLLNELPTIFLFAIVFLAVYKNMQNFLVFFGGLMAFGFFLFYMAKLYKNHREKK
jgi:putative membrane protein